MTEHRAATNFESKEYDLLKTRDPGRGYGGEVAWPEPLPYREQVKQSFLEEAFGNTGIYVIFDRKYEFVNQRFAELFLITREQVCSPGFDPMALIAPESRKFIQEIHRLAYRGELVAPQFEFTGMRSDGSRIQCVTFIIFVPYKWGLAMHGMLHDIAIHEQRSLQATMQRYVQ
jgi:PAS domain-containing protein